jgi:hypothetical protein
MRVRTGRLESLRAMRAEFPRRTARACLFSIRPHWFLAASASSGFTLTSDTASFAEANI